MTIPISGLPVSGTLNGTFLFPVVQVGTPNITQQATLNQMSALFLSLSLGGTINGDLTLNGNSFTINNAITVFDGGPVSIVGNSLTIESSFPMFLNSATSSMTVFQASNINVATWDQNITSTGYHLTRYVSGSPADSPISVNATTGLVTLIDGATVGTIGTAGQFTIYPASGTAAILFTSGIALASNVPINPGVFTVSTLPSVTAANKGAMAFASNARNTGEGGGAGTGCLVTVNTAGTWISVWSGVAPTT